MPISIDQTCPRHLEITTKLTQNALLLHCCTFYKKSVTDVAVHLCTVSPRQGQRSCCSCCCCSFPVSEVVVSIFERGFLGYNSGSSRGWHCGLLRAIPTHLTSEVNKSLPFFFSSFFLLFVCFSCIASARIFQGPELLLSFLSSCFGVVSL